MDTEYLLSAGIHYVQKLLIQKQNKNPRKLNTVFAIIHKYINET